MFVDKKGFAGLVILMLGLGFCTAAWRSSGRNAHTEENYNAMIADSVSRYRTSFGQAAKEIIHYNSQVNWAIGGMHVIRDLRQDSTRLPVVPGPPEIVGPLTDAAEELIGSTVRFYWQTNAGDFVPISIARNRVRCSYARSAATDVVIFTIEPAKYDHVHEMDVGSLSQRAIQQLIRGHVSEALIVSTEAGSEVCPAERPVGNPSPSPPQP